MVEAEPFGTPREIVDRIRTHSFLLDIEGESEMVKEGAKNLQKQLNSALTLLSQDLYSKKSHFVLELVQNADDNQYAPGVTPHLTFHLEQQRLVTVNNEVGFNEANIQAICSVGASSKSKDKTGYIGEKGIGFKSVFTVSNAPEIHSNGFHFKFDRTDQHNLLGYVVPHWCEPTADIVADSTTIVLPAAPDYEFCDETLVDLDARLLLFLNKLRLLTLVQNGRASNYRRFDEDGISLLTVERQMEHGDTISEEARYVRSEVTYIINEQCLDEKRPGIDRSTVILAFPVDVNGEAKPEPTCQVFAFLPIRQVGFKFAIQADFILSSSREEVLTDRRWNLLLRNCIGGAFLRAVESFKLSDALAFTYLKYIPSEGDVVDPFFRTVRRSIIDALAKSACLPSSSGQWKQPGELRIADKNFRRLFPSPVALELFGFDYVDQRVQGGVELLRSLGATDIISEDVLVLFKKHGTWLQAQSLEWRAEFFAYVADVQEPLLKDGLLKCPCLPSSNGTFVVPAIANVFFPLNRTKRYGFEDELVFIDNELYEAAAKISDRIAELFRALKVRCDRPYDLVTSHILPRHKGDAWMSSSSEALLGHVRYIKDKLKDFLEAAGVNGKTETQAFQVIRDGLWIGTKLEEDETWKFARIGQLYLGKEYRPKFCIETLLAGALEQDRLVSGDYLSSRAKNQEAEVESWGQFFVRLGILLAPEVVAEGSDWKCSKDMQRLLNSPELGVRRATLECLDFYWPNYAGKLAFNAVVGRSTFAHKDTQFALSLRATQAPSRKKTVTTLSDSYYPKADVKRLLGDGLPYVDAVLSDAMLDACHITHRLDAKALVKRLKQLKVDGNDTAKQLQGIYRALDEHLWETDSAFLKQSFSSDGLIRIKGAHKAWCKPNEVSWKSNGAFMDSLFPPLQGQYRDFSRFFHDRVGVPRELPTASWVEALTRLELVDGADERKSEALAIYRKANRELTLKAGREQPVRPAWLAHFESEAVYINQRGEMVASDEYLFANDATGLAALFEDDKDLSFLAIPSSEVPRFHRLLDAGGVQRLSLSVEIEVVNSDLGLLDAELTNRVRSSTYFFARVLYAKRPDTFEDALASGLFTRLRGFEVFGVPQVNLLVSLGDYSRETTADIALSGNRAIYRIGSKSLKDRLAAELCKFMGVSVDLADTFARILMESDSVNVDDFLNVRNIGELPADLLDALDGVADVLVFNSEEEESEVLDEHVRHHEFREEAVSNLSDGSDAESFPSNGLANHTRVPGPSLTIVNAPESESREKSPGMSPDGPREPVPRIVESTSRTVAIKDTAETSGLSGEGNIRQVDGATAPSPILPANDSFSQSEGSRNQIRGSGELRDGVLPIATSQPHHSYTSASGLDNDSNWRNRETGQRRPQFKHPKNSRTRTGRLMSYAGRQSDFDKQDSEDNQSRAAAREETGRAAVEHFLTTQSSRWKSLVEMAHNNPGFDILAVAHDGTEEYIEIKGQSGAWTEEGVALTPTELLAAHQKAGRYWLCVVEYANDAKRRRLHLVRDPFGLTQQFRFDSGWRSASEIREPISLTPAKDMYIDMKGVGKGQILNAKGKGTFFKLHVILNDGRQVNKPFNPATMKLSKEPTWQE